MADLGVTQDWVLSPSLRVSPILNLHAPPTSNSGPSEQHRLICHPDYYSLVWNSLLSGLIPWSVWLLYSLCLELLLEWLLFFLHSHTSPYPWLINSTGFLLQPVVCSKSLFWSWSSKLLFDSKYLRDLIWSPHFAANFWPLLVDKISLTPELGQLWPN